MPAETCLADQLKTSTPAIVIETLTIQVGRQREARTKIDREGLVVSDAKGAPIPHPALAIERAAGSEITKILAKYGRRS